MKKLIKTSPRKSKSMKALGRPYSWNGGDGSYAYWVRGRGALVVLLHGWPVSSYHWRYTVPFLSSAGFRCLCIDLKGLGQSTASDENFDKATLARKVLTLIRSVVPTAKTFALIGHDWGGSIAIALASLAPNRVSHLIIEDEVPPGVEAPLRGKSLEHYPSWHGAFHRTADLPEKLIIGNESQYINYFLDLRFKPNSLSSSERKQFVRCYIGKSRTKNALAYYRTKEADSRFFSGIRTQKLKIPSLAIYGEYGMGPAVADSLRKLCSKVGILMAKKSGHYPAEEEPTLFNKAVLRFLSTTSLK